MAGAGGCTVDKMACTDVSLLIKWPVGEGATGDKYITCTVSPRPIVMLYVILKFGVSI